MAVLSPHSLVSSPPRSLLLPSPSRFRRPRLPSFFLPPPPSAFFTHRPRQANIRTTSSMGSAPSTSVRASASPVVDAGAVEALGDVRVYSAATGEPVFFKDLWDQNEVAVVALLRHFGCICCWELASDLRDLVPRLNSSGVKLIAIGVGTVDNAHILAERVLIQWPPIEDFNGCIHPLPFPLGYLYADPDRKAYDVLGLYFGLGRTFFNPASAKVFSRFESLKKAGKNYTIKATPDDKASVLQQGGMFVFKGKELLYARKDEGTGDHAPINEILDICCKIPAS